MIAPRAEGFAGIRVLHTRKKFGLVNCREVSIFLRFTGFVDQSCTTELLHASRIPGCRPAQLQLPRPALGRLDRQTGSPSSVHKSRCESAFRPDCSRCRVKPRRQDTDWSSF